VGQPRPPAGPRRSRRKLGPLVGHLRHRGRGRDRGRGWGCRAASRIPGRCRAPGMAGWSRIGQRRAKRLSGVRLRRSAPECLHCVCAGLLARPGAAGRLVGGARLPVKTFIRASATDAPIQCITPEDEPRSQAKSPARSPRRWGWGIPLRKRPHAGHGRCAKACPCGQALCSRH